MTTWITVQSALICLLAFIQFVTLRQLAIVTRRTSPQGARLTEDGPRIGECIRTFLPPDSNILLSTSDVHGNLILFLSSACRICENLEREVALLSDSWRREFHVLIHFDDGDPAFDARSANLKRFTAISTLKSPLRTNLGIGFVPYAVLLDSQLRVVKKALVNNAHHVESLFDAEILVSRQ